MYAPPDIFSDGFLDDNEKKVFEFFLLRWALYYYKIGDVPRWYTVIKEMLGYQDEQEFINILVDFENTLTVEDYFKNLKRYGKRPITTQELIAQLNGTVAKRNILKHLALLKKHGIVKKITKPIGKHQVTFYFHI